LFNDKERAIVGTLYKNSGRDASVLKGMELVGPKLASFVKEARKISKDRSLLIHCWRGGLRSKNMAWLLHTAGFEVKVLEGGYKAYRRFIRQKLGDNRILIVVGGKTGSGKTEILRELKSRGKQILDLEYMAHHKGSAFGDLGQEAQPTNEQFENNLYEIWRSFDPGKPIWTEDESRGIGRVSIPDTLFDIIRNSPVIFIDIPKDIRVKRLVKEYAGFDKQELIAAIERIGKRLGGLNVKLAEEAILRDDFETAIAIVLRHYDKSYLKGLEFRDRDKVHTIKSASGDAKVNARKILDHYKKHLTVETY
jgi:tRNA 2-selenouridine synthase